MKPIRLAISNVLIALLLVVSAGCAQQSSLVEAVKGDDARLVKSLLDKGANVNQSDQYGVAGLHVAADSNSTEIIRLLVKNGADVNVTNSFGETPLMLLIKNGPGDRFDNVKYLVKQGADVNATGSIGDTALANATAKGETKIVNFLLEHGASVDTCLAIPFQALIGTRVPCPKWPK